MRAVRQRFSHLIGASPGIIIPALFENHIPPAVEDDQAVVGNHFGWAVRDDVKNESVIEPVAVLVLCCSTYLEIRLRGSFLRAPKPGEHFGFS